MQILEKAPIQSLNCIKVIIFWVFMDKYEFINYCILELTQYKTRKGTLAPSAGKKGFIYSSVFYVVEL